MRVWWGPGGLPCRLFDYEEIDGAGRCAYLQRWVLLRLPARMAVYLHRFVGSDWSRDYHDHPRRFVSVGLRGRYIEEGPGRPDVEYRAPWCRTFLAEHVHRVRLHPGESCWTLVFVGLVVRPWGFWKPAPTAREPWKRAWVHWREYLGTARADAAKDC